MSLTFRFSVTKAQNSCNSLSAACFQTPNCSLVNQLPLQISWESLDEGVSLQPHLFPSKENAYSISQCNVVNYLHTNHSYASVFEPPKLKKTLHDSAHFHSTGVVQLIAPVWFGIQRFSLSPSWRKESSVLFGCYWAHSCNVDKKKKTHQLGQ
jgi:hypothetical protein